MIKKIIIFLLLISALSFVSFKLFSPLFFTKVERKIDQTIVQVEEIKETIIPQPTKILSNGLPNKYLIKTAFVPQSPEKNWDQPWQDACEEAALLTVDYFYKDQNPSSETIKNDILKMITFEDGQSLNKDVDLEEMALIAEKYLNYSTKIINNPSVEDLKKYLIKDIPIIIPANGKTLYRENKHFNSGGPYYHNLTILGFDDSKGKFIVHDVGTKSGAYFHYSYSLLMESIHDFPDSKQKTDIDNGPKQVLILLK